MNSNIVPIPDRKNVDKRHSKTNCRVVRIAEINDPIAEVDYVDQIKDGVEEIAEIGRFIKKVSLFLDASSNL